MIDEKLLSVPLVVMFLLEMVKIGVRYIKKDPNLDFDPKFYALVIPFMTFLGDWVFGLVGWGEPIAIEWMYVLRWGLNIVLTLAMYQLSIKPFKDYIGNVAFSRELKEVDNVK